MIDVKELRVGNLVFRKFYSSDGNEVREMIIPYFSQLDRLEPIPITEEWIKKFNVFETKDKMWRFNNYVIEHWYDMYLIKYISMTNQLIQIGTKIEYVHQFQNIAFALTQTELELK